MKRRPFIAGNWKLNKTVTEARSLARGLKSGLASQRDVDVCVAPVATSLFPVVEALSGSGVHVAAQNTHYADKGAFTGELSPTLIKDVGCSHCIIGHSERRQIFGETDEGVRKKAAALLSHDVVPILCCGETLAQREAGDTLKVVLSQIDAALDGLRHDEASRVILAYEPIWAIGTGRTASPSDAQAVHAGIRQRLSDRFDAPLARSVRILYGGSVKPANAASLLSEQDIDGALVGGASLTSESFLAIIAAAG